MYKPGMYVKDLFSVNYKNLKQKGIKCLLIDIDNTMARVDEKTPSSDIKKLVKELKKDFKVIILSNALPVRVKHFMKELDVDGYCLSWKPNTKTYKRVLKDYEYLSNEIAAIGDQLCTDVKGANRMQMFSVLVDQIAKKEFITTKLARLKEKRIIKNDKVIKRGEYYE